MCSPVFWYQYTKSPSYAWHINEPLKKCEKEIERLETRNAEIDEEMSAPDVATNVAKLQALAKEQASIQEALEKLYEEWETLAE